MRSATHEAWLQVSAGHGPAECAWAVVNVTKEILAEAGRSDIEARVIESLAGESGAQSTLIALTARAPLASFLARWSGTVQWVARSPFRPQHRRKNWFVGVQALEPAAATRFDPRDVTVETMRASGAGGQHVNRTESAVRVTHVPTGLQARASEERSQHANRRLAFARLERRLAEHDAEACAQAAGRRWRAHQELERGNPVRVLGPGAPASRA